MLSSLFSITTPVLKVHAHLEHPVGTGAFERSAERGEVEEITPPPRKAAVKHTAAAPAAEGRERLEDRIENQRTTLPVCWRGEGPSGPGVAEVTYTPDGLAVVKLAPPYADTPVGSCVKRHLALAAQPFEGAPATVTIAFTL